MKNPLVPQYSHAGSFGQDSSANWELSGPVRLTTGTVDLFKSSRFPRFEDIEWEYLPPDNYRVGDILQIIRWPFALRVCKITPGFNAGYTDDIEDYGELELDIVVLHALGKDE